MREQVKRARVLRIRIYALATQAHSSRGIVPLKVRFSHI
jgi:hypothetical protein